MAIMKEDRQAFGLIISKAISLEDAFMYPITSVPLALATTENGLRQSDKASFRNFLINTANSEIPEVPKYCTWLVDGMAVVRSMKPKNTYQKFYESLLNFITPDTKYEPKGIVFCSDVYKVRSVKDGCRTDRGLPGPRICIDGFEQRMMKGQNWQEFLHNKENKNDLLHMLCEFIKLPENRNKLPCPVIINDKENVHLISKDDDTYLYDVNHEEADTRLILHAIVSGTDAVVVCKDTDVLVLMIWAYHTFNIKKRWFMKYERGKFADIEVICRSLGPDICTNLLAIHAISGCDTTSYMHRVGKVRLMRKLLKDPSMSRLLGPLSQTEPLKEESIDDIKTFVQCIMYNGGANETYIET